MATSFEIIDALTVVGPWRDRPPGRPYGFDDLLREHERFGITRRLTLHAESRDGVPDNGNTEMTRLTVLRTDTAPIWTVLPPRRFGGPAVDVLLGDAQAAGVAMFALFPETHGHHLAPWANGDLYGAMESARLPLLLDVGNAMGSEARRRYEEIHAVASAHPRLPIVLWNAFYMDERLQVPLLDDCPNVHVGIATVFIPTWGIEQHTARYGPGRLIFGSNWPQQSPGPLLTYVRYAEVDDRARQAILGGTVRSLAADVRWPVHGFEEPTPGQDE
jgi:predicted TIM-barrel fold metal-dependent hydrolase